MNDLFAIQWKTSKENAMKCIHVHKKIRLYWQPFGVHGWTYEDHVMARVYKITAGERIAWSKKKLFILLSYIMNGKILSH